MGKLLTVNEAVDVSGIPYFTLLRLLHEKKLRGVKLPGRRSWFIDPADLTAMIEASKTGTNAGTLDENEPSEVTTNKAPQKRRQSGNETAVLDGKFQWMQSYEPKRRRK